MTPIQINEAVWLEEIEDKIVRKHQVWPGEVEQTLQNRPHIRFMERGHRPDEDVLAEVREAATARGLSIESLANLWLQERALSAKSKVTAAADARAKYAARNDE